MRASDAPRTFPTGLQQGRGVTQGHIITSSLRVHDCTCCGRGSCGGWPGYGTTPLHRTAFKHTCPPEVAGRHSCSLGAHGHAVLLHEYMAPRLGGRCCLHLWHMPAQLACP